MLILHYSDGRNVVQLHEGHHYIMPTISKLLTLRLWKGDDFIKEVVWDKPILKIGKLASADIRIEDKLTSRMHALLEVRGQDVVLIDLGSVSGTFVNGQKRTQIQLKSGDSILVGETRIEVTFQ